MAIRYASIAILGFFLLAPWLTLAHELGHALLPLWSGRSVQVCLGSCNGWVFELGALQLAVSNGFNAGHGYTRVIGQESLSIAGTALGPIVSLALGLVAHGAYRAAPIRFWFARSMLQFAAIWCIVQFAATAAPIRYPEFFSSNYGDFYSDGMKIWAALTDRNGP